MEKIFEKFKDKLIQKVLEDFEIELVLIPKKKKDLIIKEKEEKDLIIKKKIATATNIKELKSDPVVDFLINKGKKPPSRIKRFKDKGGEVQKKADRILSILKDNYPKALSYPDVNDLLGIPEDNFNERQKTPYYMSKLINQMKVEMSRDPDNHKIFRAKQEVKDGK